MTVYTANPGDNLQTKVSALVAGDTLQLNDGVYNTSPGLNVSGINGAAGNVITIKAVNEGNVILDGLSTFAPFFVTNASYVTFQGLRAQNSVSNVIYLFSGIGSGNGPLDHITLQRCTAHGSGTQNSHCFSISQNTGQAPPSALTNILIEDCASEAPGRYMFVAYHCDTVIFRRCYGYWHSIQDTLNEPRAPFSVYGSKNVTIENCIGLGCLPYQTETFNNSFTACWHTTDDTVNYPCDNTKVYGSIFYNNWEGWWVNDSAGTSLLFQDCYFETPLDTDTWTNQAKGDGFSVNSGYTAPKTATIQNCVFRNSVQGWIKRTAGDTPTLTIKNNLIIGNTTGMVNDPGHTSCGFFGNTPNGTTLVASDIAADPLFDTATYGRGAACFVSNGSPYKGAGAAGADIGCHILYQYINGVLGSTPLWPWPMEARIQNELARSPTYTSGGGVWNSLVGLYPLATPYMLYGSAVANGTLASACTMVNAGGGVETSKLTVTGNGQVYAEIWSKGQGVAQTSFAAIPAPTGNGWIFFPGIAGTFQAGNWQVLGLTLSSVSTPTSLNVRFSRYRAGVYTTIGLATLTTGLQTAKKAYALSVAASAIALLIADGIYVDVWWGDNNTSVNGDNPTIYLATLATAGVLGDMQIVTPAMVTGATSHLIHADSLGGVYV
jgi:hypothetical protein